jgi:prepilin-type N-terminal cleavage/methylation domain-containing protein
MDKVRRKGVTLIELLVVMTMLGILLALLMPAIQKVRQASKREACAERLMQIGLALYSYHDVNGSLPSGLDVSRPSPPDDPNYYWYWSWMARLLPYVDQEDLWRQADAFARYGSGQIDPWAPGFDPTTGQQVPSNPALGVPLQLWQCPADSRELVAMYNNLTVAFTEYQGVSGLHAYGLGLESRNEGLFFNRSHVRFADITNGLSNVLAVGERPPSGGFLYGWWFAGAGQNGSTTGSADVVLGIAEINFSFRRCPGYNDPNYQYRFGPGDPNNQCDDFHYWSLHHHGANFLLADGSAHFYKYTIDPAVLIAMAYRSGGPP